MLNRAGGWALLPPNAPVPVGGRARWKRAWHIARVAAGRWRDGYAWLGAFLGPIEYTAWRLLHERHGVER